MHQPVEERNSFFSPWVKTFILFCLWVGVFFVVVKPVEIYREYAAERDPNYKRAGDLVRNKEFEEALIYFEKTIEEYPKFSPAYVESSYAYEILGDSSKSIALLNQAIELDPNEGYLYAARGWLYYKNGDLELALEDCDRIPRLYLDAAWRTYNQRAYLYLGLDRIDEAYKAAQYALELSPDEPWVLDTLGDVYMALKEYDKAAEWYSRAIIEAGDTEPDLSYYYENRASAYRLFGDVSAAEADEETVRQLGE